MKKVTLLITLLLLALVEVVFCPSYRKLKLRYFEYLLFPCLNYQSILGQCFFSLPQGHIGKTKGFLPFSRVVEKKHLPEIG